MQKTRNLDDIMDLLTTVRDNFSLIRDVSKEYPASIPTAEQFTISLTICIEPHDFRAHTVEKAIKALLGVDDGCSSVIFCWKHTGLTLFVFKTVY